MASTYEFAGERSRSYKRALSQFPDVWPEDMLLMKRALSPQSGDTVLEIGAGSGFFSFEIAKAIGETGHLFVLDPSPEQLQPIVEKKPVNISVMQATADELNLPDDTRLDAIWSRGAIHHAQNKTQIFQRLYQHAKPGARMVICDVFAGSKLADYFDGHVAKTCTTGHEVAFLSEHFARSLCYITGWSEPTFEEIPFAWHFKTQEDIGVFLSLLHSNKPEFSAEDSLEDAKKMLGVKQVEGGWDLHWPMTLMQTTKP